MDLNELEAELRAILVPYEDALEAAEIYGIEVLHRPGARAHDWFAGVRPGKGTTKLMLLPIKAHPELVEDISPALRKRLSGDALFTLKAGDEALLPELAAARPAKLRRVRRSATWRAALDQVASSQSRTTRRNSSGASYWGMCPTPWNS